MPTTVTIPARLSEASSAAVSVEWATRAGTALAGSSFVAAAGILTWAPGETVKNVTVTIPDNAPAGVFYVDISNPTGGVLATVPVSTVTLEAGTQPGALLLTVNFVSLLPEPAAPILPPLSAVGNQFVDSDGAKVRLRAINWYGADGPSLAPLGLYRNRSYQEMIDQIAGLGFNCIRYVFADDMLTSTVTFGVSPGDQFVGSANADLHGLTPIQAFTKIAQYCATKGVRILLDHHRISIRPVGNGDSGFGTDGWPTMTLNTSTWLYGGSSTPRTYTETTWGDFWVALATYCTTGLWASDPKLRNVIWGFEPHNEPHRVTWDMWAGMCERLYPRVRAVAPDWMMVVGGVATNVAGTEDFWWGGWFKDVATRPVTVSPGQNKVCYTPHEYAHSVADQPWLSANAQTAGAPYPALASRVVASYPQNIEALRDEYWGFIYRDNIAPLLIGEFGAGCGLDAVTGLADPAQTSGAFEVQWMQSLVTYMNGTRNDNTSMVPLGGQGMSFAYFALNPESGNPLGGLLRGIDGTSVQNLKMNILLPLFDQG